VRTRRQTVTQFALESGLPDPWAVTIRDLEQWLAEHEWMPETKYMHRCGLRSFYRWALERGYRDDDPTVQLARLRRPPARPRACPDTHVLTALGEADERTALMLRLAAEHGLRRAEIAGLHSRDLIREATGWALRIRGKGGVVRHVPLHDGEQDLVDAIRAAAPGFVFPGRVDGHLSPGHVGELVKAVLPPGWTTHSLRHRFATAAYARKRDVFTLQAVLGHASPSTTVRYVQLPEDAGRDLVQAAQLAV
jgi:integrase